LSNRDCVESPHVLITDDFNNRTGHLLAVQIDSLQQRLQPAHVTFNVGVEEGKNLAYRALKGNKHPAAVKQITKFQVGVNLLGNKYNSDSEVCILMLKNLRGSCLFK